MQLALQDIGQLTDIEAAGDRIPDLPRTARYRRTLSISDCGSDTNEGFGAERYEMNTRHVPKIDRRAAEQLLDGATEHESGKLTRMLAAARAPGRDDELAGEDTAVAAFEAAHLVPVGNPRTDQESKSMLGKLLTAKILAASLAAVTTGGVALAAATGAFSGSGAATGAGPTIVGVSQASSSTSQPEAASPQSAASTPGVSSAGGQASATSAPAPTVPETATALCRTLASEAMSSVTSITTESGLEAALSSSAVSSVLDNSEFAPLTAAAGASTNVPDYCALLLKLPRLPRPDDLPKLPVGVLSSLLTSLPAPTLSQVLTGVPGSVLAVVLPELPSSVVSHLFSELPSSVLSQLPSSVVSKLGLG
jgi:hypothetical protein